MERRLDDRFINILPMFATLKTSHPPFSEAETVAKKLLLLWPQ